MVRCSGVAKGGPGGPDLSERRTNLLNHGYKTVKKAQAELQRTCKNSVFVRFLSGIISRHSFRWDCEMFPIKTGIRSRLLQSGPYRGEGGRIGTNYQDRALLGDLASVPVFKIKQPFNQGHRLMRTSVIADGKCPPLEVRTNRSSLYLVHI